MRLADLPRLAPAYAWAPAPQPYTAPRPGPVPPPDPVAPPAGNGVNWAWVAPLIATAGLAILAYLGKVLAVVIRRARPVAAGPD